MYGCEPYWTALVVRTAAVRAHTVYWRSRRQGELWRLAGRAKDGAAQWLGGERLASAALPHVAQLAGALLARRLPTHHHHEHPHVEVNAKTEERADCSAGPGGGRLHALQQHSHRELVAAAGLQGDGAVLSVACLGAVTAQYGHVGGGDAEQAAVPIHRLHRAVQERGGAAQTSVRTIAIDLR